MAIGVITNESSLALTEEVTEGTYNAPSAGTDYIEVLSEGLEINKTRENLERQTLNATVEKEKSRIGLPDVTGSVPVELRASTTEGAAPQALDLQLKSLLGGNRSAATQTTTTGNTSTVLEFGATPNFAKGDCVLVKEAGAFEVRPISAVGATTITFPFALDNGAPSDGVVVAAVESYFHDTSSSISLSAEHNIGDEIQQQVSGLRAASGTIENWSVGQIPTMTFSYNGVGLERADSAGTASPDFSADAEPPVALEACLWIGGVLRAYTELGLSIENTVAPLKNACLANGKSGTRITDQTVSFTANPYMDDTSLDTWDDFNDNDDTSVFFYAFNPSTTAGEFSEAVAVWIPQGSFTEHNVGDEEGVATNAVSIQAHHSTSGSNDSIFMSFI